MPSSIVLFGYSSRVEVPHEQVFLRPFPIGEVRSKDEGRR